MNSGQLFFVFSATSSTSDASSTRTRTLPSTLSTAEVTASNNGNRATVPSLGVKHVIVKHVEWITRN